MVKLKIVTKIRIFTKKIKISLLLILPLVQIEIIAKKHYRNESNKNNNIVTKIGI